MQLGEHVTSLSETDILMLAHFVDWAKPRGFLHMHATADFDFQLGEAAEMIPHSASRFADAQIKPLADRTDREDHFPRHRWKPMGALGLHGIAVEDEWGELGLGYLEHVIAVEEVSRASASIGLSHGAHSGLIWPISSGSLSC